MNSGNLVIKGKEEINQIKLKDKFENIKSDYFLQMLFNNLQKKSLLNILKYNKVIKKRINININDYIEYSKLYSSIEIEIKIANNKYGKFFDFEKENELYFHIFFDNKKEEKKRNYINKNEQVNIVKIIIDNQVKTLGIKFNESDCIEAIYFKKFYRININYKSRMFSGCSSLRELNLNNFNIKNETSLSWIFRGCSLLKEITINNFNINNVVSIASLFDECSSLKKININQNFNINHVTSIGRLFFGCLSLEEININNFNINNVVSIASLFGECSSLKKINIINFNINQVTSISNMFEGCSSLEELNIKNIKFNDVVSIRNMFSGCSIELVMNIKERYKNLIK